MELEQPKGYTVFMVIWDLHRRLLEVELVDSMEFDEVDEEACHLLGEAPEDLKRMLSLVVRMSEGPTKTEGDRSGELSQNDQTELRHRKHGVLMDLLEKMIEHTLLSHFPQAYQNNNEPYVGQNWMVYAIPSDNRSAHENGSGESYRNGKPIVFQ